jgi:hypothetical protein
MPILLIIFNILNIKTFFSLKLNLKTQKMSNNKLF